LLPTYEKGDVVTRQFVFEGKKLKISADVTEGYVRVGVLQPSFQPYEGFSAEECHPVKSDDPKKI